LKLERAITGIYSVAATGKYFAKNVCFGTSWREFSMQNSASMNRNEEFSARYHDLCCKLFVLISILLSGFEASEQMERWAW
jgi:hypothetical protein